MELDTRLSTKQRQRLHGWLTADARPDETLGLCGVHGLLCAVVPAPQVMPAARWVPAVFGERGEEYFRGLAEPGEGLALLIGFYNEVMNDAFEEALRLPPDCPVLQPADRNLAPGAALRDWSDGFERGYRLVSPVWAEYCSQGMEQELDACLISLMYFGPAARAEALRRETAEDHGMTVDAFAENAVQQIPAALQSYARMGLAIDDALFEAEVASAGGFDPAPAARPAQEPVRREKVGRNEPCPCGSGCKYKKCCGSPAKP